MLAKTSRPRLPVVYTRARLFDRLDTARRNYSATVVIAPPGAGKTTLISSYLRVRNLGCLWYQIDSGDEDVATFFHYFGQAAKRHMHGDAEPLPDFEPGAAPDLGTFSRQYFRRFFDALKAPLVVVFDNYQELSDTSPLHDVAHVACRETPAESHLIIVTREACPQPLGRMRFNRGLTIIGPDEMVLTPDEACGIAEKLGTRLSPSAARELQSRSAGWMMGFVLLLERAAGNDFGARALTPRSAQEPLLFDYFAHEIYMKLDAGRRDLLLETALLPRMTLDRVTALTRTPKAGTVLMELVRRNYFVTLHEGPKPAYQFHPLFREFLLSQIAQRHPAAALDAMQRRAAEVLIADEDHETAIDLLEQARSWERMAEVIVARAQALTAQGRIATLDAWLRKLPAELIGSNPWLLYWQGTSKAYAEPARGQALLEDAYRKFRVLDDFLGLALSWVGVVEAVLSIHSDLCQMDLWIAEFNDRIQARIGELPPDLGGRVTLAFFTALSYRQPLHPDMGSWLDRVRKRLETETRAAERSRLRQRLVTYHLLRGEHTQAESVITLFHYADDLRTSERSSFTAVDHLNEALVALHVGMRDRCLRAVLEGLRAGERTGSRLLDPVFLQMGAAMSLNRGDVPRADGFLADFERLTEGQESIDRGAYYAVAAWRKLQCGESILARELLQRAVAASEARGTPYYIAVDHLGLGLLLHLCGDPKGAARSLELGRRIGASIRNPLIEFAWHLFSAHVALAASARGKARAHLADGMRIGREHGYMHFIHFPPRIVAQLCLVALEEDIEPAYVQALVERNGLVPDPGWRQAEAWPWLIRIYTLGRFGVVKQGSVLRFTGKAQKKPLELLKALIAFGGRDVPETRLLDALWPDAEGDAASQALATTLFRLRKLIGERTIRRQENRLTLDPSVCWVDSWAFERLTGDETADPKSRASRLQRLYQGPFLDGEEVPWACPMRDRLSAKRARLGGPIPPP